MAKKNKEQYALQMEAYKQKKDEEAGHFMKEEEDHMKLQKQQALQLLKKQRDKTVRITKAWIEKAMGTKCIFRLLFNKKKG